MTGSTGNHSSAGSGGGDDLTHVLLREFQEMRAEFRNSTSHSPHLHGVVHGGGGSWWPLLLFMALTGLLIYRYRRAIVERVVQRNATDVLAVLNHMGPEELKKALGDVELPSWIAFPDVQRVEFINTVLKQLWPYICSFAGEMVQKLVPEILEANKPNFIEAIQMKAFSLGDIPPQLSGIKVFAHDENARPTDVTMEMDFFWPSNVHFAMAVSLLPNIKFVPFASKLSKAAADYLQARAAMEDLNIRGQVRIVLKPLQNDLPIVNAIQISLVRQPKFSYNLDLFGADIKMVPGLEPWINSLIADVALKPYILPDKVVIPLVAGSVEDTDEPSGLLQVKVLEGEHVPRSDLFSNGDPYVRLFLRALREQKTQEKHGKNVTWNETFRLVVHADDTQELTVVLMDADVIGQDDELGRGKVKIADLTPGREEDIWLEMESAEAVEGHDDSVKEELAGSTPEADAERENRKITPKGTKAVEAGLKSLNVVKGNRKACRVHLQCTYLRFSEDQRQVALDTLTHGPEDPEGHVGNRLPLGDPAREMLEGAVLQVRIGKLEHLSKNSKLHLPGLGPKAKVEVRVAGQVKESKPVPSATDPLMDQVLEFTLDQRQAGTANGFVEILVEDNHIFGSRKGSCRIPLKELKAVRRLMETYPLAGLPKVSMHVDCHWLTPMEAS